MVPEAKACLSPWAWDLETLPWLDAIPHAACSVRTHKGLGLTPNIQLSPEPREPRE